MRMDFSMNVACVYVAYVYFESIQAHASKQAYASKGVGCGPKAPLHASLALFQLNLNHAVVMAASIPQCCFPGCKEV